MLYSNPFIFRVSATTPRKLSSQLFLGTMILGGEKQNSQGEMTKWIFKMLPYFEKGNYINHDSSYLGELVLDMIDHKLSFPTVATLQH